jgi:hypothetical protein
MKLDKETLIKHRFWVAVAACGFLTLIAIIALVFIVPRAANAARKKVEDKWAAFDAKKLKSWDVKNDSFIEMGQKKADKEKENETKVWAVASGAQKTLFPFPREFEGEFEFHKGLFAYEVNVQGKDAKPTEQPEGEPKKEEVEPKKEDAEPEKDKAEGKKDDPEPKKEAGEVKKGAGKAKKEAGEAKEDEVQPKKEVPEAKEDDSEAKAQAKKKADQAKSPIGTFEGKLIEYNAEYIKVLGKKGKTVVTETFHRIPGVKITTPDEKEKPRFPSLEKYANEDPNKAALIKVSYFKGRRFNDPLTDRERIRFVETYRSQLMDVLREAGPLNDGRQPVVGFPNWSFGKKLPSPESRFFRFVPEWKTQDLDISHEAWLAQEDLWIQRELFRLVKKANDSLANFEQVKGMPKRFVNPYWQLDVIELKDNQLTFQLKNLLDRPQAVNVTFQVQFEKGKKFFPLDVVSDSAPLPPGGTFKEAKTRKIDGPVGKQIVGIRQELTWETAAVRRIDHVSIGASGDEWSLAHRMANKTLQPLKKKAETPDTKSGESNTGPSEGKDMKSKGSGVFSAKGGLPSLGSKGDNAPEAGRTPNGLIETRYLEVTPQARRLPVAIVLIVDQAHVSRVEAAFADSPLRFLLTQVLMHRYPKSARPPEGPSAVEPPPPEKLVTTPGDVKFPKGPKGPPFRSKGGSGDFKGPPSTGSFPGFGSKSGPPASGGSSMYTPGLIYGAPEVASGTDDQESNIELVLYGVVSLYEPYPPRPASALPAAEAPPPTEAGPKE